MPYLWLREMSDRDALAVARYLRTLRPIHNDVVQRPSIWFKLGKLLFLGPSASGSATAPLPGPTAIYGEYLAQHASLCADCHTPRTGLLSKPNRRRLFAGDAHPPNDFPANPSNLTPDRASGIGRWSEADFVRTMRTGVNPQGDSLHPFMPWRANRRMTDDDLRAIYRYLRTLPPIENQVPRRTAVR
jgi:mono/diheme cytochrome c family protein